MSARCTPQGPMRVDARRSRGRWWAEDAAAGRMDLESYTALRYGSGFDPI